MKITEAQVKQVEQKGLSIEALAKQLNLFVQGTKYMNLQRYARVVDGIQKLSTAKIKEFEDQYTQSISDKSISKFIPASGAATRMFKDLYEYLETQKESNYLITFFENLKKFAFYKPLGEKISNDGFNIEELLKDKKYDKIIEYLLYDKGLSYGNLPKGLVAFHAEKQSIVTPIGEHIKELKAYAGDSPELCFTISETYVTHFEEIIQEEIQRQNVKIKHTLSFQKPNTDTIAVTKDLKPVAISEKELLFRPGGHGALIQNLNEIESDIIFIKNIDNVCSEKHLSETVKYKKALVSILLEVQKKIFSFANKLKNYDGRDKRFNIELRTFLEQELSIFSKEICNMTTECRLKFFKEKLNRPLRVCGMVKNEGEPGGGPFWVKDKEGTISLQIIESSQINYKDEKQSSIARHATHFNPVDIVCAVKDKTGNKYDLTKFVDKDAFFIAEKSFKGKEILALEHPGLWNGGMGDWNTIFVEVPSLTFNPVKTVNDLLRKAHQD